MGSSSKANGATSGNENFPAAEAAAAADEAAVGEGFGDGLLRRAPCRGLLVLANACGCTLVCLGEPSRGTVVAARDKFTDAVALVAAPIRRSCPPPPTNEPTAGNADENGEPFLGPAAEPAPEAEDEVDVEVWATGEVVGVGKRPRRTT